MTDSSLTVLFMPESAYGPTNNCAGIGNVLLHRGHRVVFAAEASWAGKLSALGFEEDLVHLTPPADQPEDAGQFWKDFIRATAPEFRKPTIEQLDTWVKPVWAELVAGARYCEPQLKAIIERTRPDVIVEDNVVGFPALTTAGVPFVRIVSCNPLEVKDPGIAPVFSGYPAGDPSQWAAFRAEYDRTHRQLWTEFNEFVVAQGAAPLPDLEFIHEGDLNLYVYPEIADYQRRQPLGSTWHRLESSVRETDEKFELPDLPGDGALIYFSLGSLGSADVELMRTLVAELAEAPYRFIVSKGPQASEFELAANMVGAEFLPQTSVLPQVDLVITHGGNNTVTESLYFGKPMVLLPVFWDQHDNARRIDETGFGIRVDTYAHEPEELRGAIARLLDDGALADRLARASRRLQAAPGTELAADLIERTVLTAG